MTTTTRRRPANGMPTDWHTDAECRDEDLVLFFGYEGERYAEKALRETSAKAVCAQCPVRAECLDYALSRPEKYGIWGGLDEDQRAREQRRRARTRSN